MSPKHLLFVVGFAMLTGHAAIAAPHHPRKELYQCDDMGFAGIGNEWVANRYCQEEVAARQAHARGEHYTARQFHHSDTAVEEFCRGNPSIEVYTLCAPYNN